MRHLVNQSVGIAQIKDLGDYVIVNHLLRNPENGIGARLPSVYRVEHLAGQFLVVLIVLAGEVGHHVIRERAGQQIDQVALDQRSYPLIERRPVPRGRAISIHGGPLHGHGQRRGDVQVQRLPVHLMCVQEAEIAGTIIVDEILDHAARLKGLVAVNHHRHLGPAGACGSGNPILQDAVEAILRHPVVFGDKVVIDRVAHVAAPADVSGARIAAVARIACSVLGGEHLVVESGRTQSVPSRVQQRLATDGEFNRVELGVEIGIHEPVRIVLIPRYYSVSGKVLSPSGSVVVMIQINVDPPLARLVASHHYLPPAAGDGIHLVRQVHLTLRRIADVNDHIDIEIAFLGVGLEVKKVHPEIELAVSAAPGIPTIPDIERNDIPRLIPPVPRLVNVTTLVVRSHPLVFIQHNAVVRCPVHELLVVGGPVQYPYCLAGTDHYGAFRRRLSSIRNTGIRPVLIFQQIDIGIGHRALNDKIIVRIAVCSIDH